MAGLWLYLIKVSHVFEYAPVLNVSELGIWQGSEFVRITEGAEYTLTLNGPIPDKVKKLS